MSRTSRGKFITVEGPDGAGKTTNLTVIEQCLTARGIAPVLTREPGGTGLGNQVRGMLLEQHDLNVSPLAQTLLLFAAREQHIQEVIEPALARGDWVLCDRFTDATRAYQGGGHGVDSERIETLADWVHSHQTPDLTLIFDVPVAVGQTRLGDSVTDRFETQANAFKQRVRKTYHLLEKEEPERVHIIDTNRDRDVVSDDVVQVITAFVDRIGDAK